jgi:deazaflavin-dependent oxidoreductase (nitroreductase family)
LNRSARSRFGQVVGRVLAPQIDPWLGRVSSGRASLGMFSVPSATLETTGARSGRLRETQVAYFHDGPNAIVMASNYGGDKHPQWYHNLLAHPSCELGNEPFRAEEVTDADEYAKAVPARRGLLRRLHGLPRKNSADRTRHSGVTPHEALANRPRPNIAALASDISA